LIRNLQAKVEAADHKSRYNTQAIENVGTAIVLILETLQMNLAAEEQDENDRYSIALLGSR